MLLTQGTVPTTFRSIVVDDDRSPWPGLVFIQFCPLDLNSFDPIECVSCGYRLDQQQGQQDRLTVLLKKEKRMKQTVPLFSRAAGNRLSVRDSHHRLSLSNVINSGTRQEYHRSRSPKTAGEVFPIWTLCILCILIFVMHTTSLLQNTVLLEGFVDTKLTLS